MGTQFTHLSVTIEGTPYQLVLWLFAKKSLIKRLSRIRLVKEPLEVPIEAFSKIPKGPLSVVSRL